MILKIMSFEKDKTEGKIFSSIDTELFEGDNISHNDGSIPNEPEFERGKEVVRPTIKGVWFHIRKNNSVVFDRFISENKIKDRLVKVYILNDNGKTIGKPIG